MPKTEWPQVLVLSSTPGRWLPGLSMFEAWPGLKRRAFWSRVSIGCAGSMIRNCKQWPDPGPGCNLYKSFETIWAFLKMWGRAERSPKPWAQNALYIYIALSGWFMRKPSKWGAPNFNGLPFFSISFGRWCFAVRRLGVIFEAFLLHFPKHNKKTTQIQNDKPAWWKNDTIHNNYLRFSSACKPKIFLMLE